MHTSGLLSAGGGGAAGAGAGAAGWGELGAGAEALAGPASKQFRRPVRAATALHLRHLADELLQAKFRLLTPFGVLRRACSAADSVITELATNLNATLHITQFKVNHECYLS
jgi:hypothetical protein